MTCVRNASKIYVANVSPDARDGDIGRLFEDCGKIASLEHKNNYAFVEYFDTADAEEAIRRYNRSDFMGKRLVVEPYAYRGGDFRYRPSAAPNPMKFRVRNTRYRLHVTGLDPNTSWPELKDFARHGGRAICYTDVFVRDGNYEGLIDYYNRDDYEFALKTLDGARLKGGRVRILQEREYERRFPNANISHARAQSNHNQNHHPGHGHGHGHGGNRGAPSASRGPRPRPRRRPPLGSSAGLSGPRRRTFGGGHRYDRNGFRVFGSGSGDRGGYNHRHYNGNNGGPRYAGQAAHPQSSSNYAPRRSRSPSDRRNYNEYNEYNNENIHNRNRNHNRHYRQRSRSRSRPRDRDRDRDRVGDREARRQMSAERERFVKEEPGGYANNNSHSNDDTRSFPAQQPIKYENRHSRSNSRARYESRIN